MSFTSLLLPFIALALFAAQGNAQSLKLQYEASLPSKDRDMIESDLRLLKQLNLKDGDGELARIFGFKTTNSQSMEAWLAKRARFIVDETFDYQSSNLVTLAKRASYKLPSEVAEDSQFASQQKQNNRLAEKAKTKVASMAVEADKRPYILMTNLTATIYPFARYKRRLFGLEIDGIGVVPITSSQLGIFQIGNGFFRYSSLDKSADPLKSFSTRMKRLKTLIHEARHGDGNDDNANFPHVECPEGHEMEGLRACDLSANGPYRVASLFLSSALQSCQADASCNATDAELMKLIIANDLSRILSPLKPTKIDGKLTQPTEFDPTPEIVEVVK